MSATTSAPRDRDPDNATQPAPTRRRRPRAAIIAGVAVGVSAALALAGATVVSGSSDVPRGTTVLGVEIGGMDQAEAITALAAGLRHRMTTPVPVTVGRMPAMLDPAAVDLRVDAEATVRSAVTKWPNPFMVLFGKERQLEPTVVLDRVKLNLALAKPVSTVARPAVPASVSYRGLIPIPNYGVAGQGLNGPRAASELESGWLRRAVIDLPLTESVPTPHADVDRLVTEFAKPAIAAPVTVTVGGSKVVVTPASIAKSLVMMADSTGEITPRVDDAKLRAALASQLARIEVKPSEAVVPGAGGQRSVASVGGKLVDTGTLSRDLLAVLPKAAPRTVPATLITVANRVEPELMRQGIVEQVSTFTTTFDSAGQSRNKNILQVAKEVDGAIVKPGETFSLNGFTGPRSYEQGYVDAPVISDGKLVNAVGGGISQFTTTLFNAMYYAGLEDVFHQPHSYYFSRYPSVIESTIFYPTLDMKFRNDSTHSVLIDTSFTDRSVTVAMWSTKRYDITTQWDPRFATTKPKTVHLPDDDRCIATAGIDGFSQRAWRIFSQDGREIKRELFSHDYKSEPRFVCGG